MTNKDKNFEYNEELDSLYIYGERADTENIAGSIVVGNLVFDISSSGNFVGLEIDNASAVFNISSALLSTIDGAKITTTTQGNIIILTFGIKLDKKEYNFSYMVPKNKIVLNA